VNAPADAPPATSIDANVSAQQPSRTRYWVIVFAVALAVIQYIDRVCISKAAPTMQDKLGLTKDDMGTIFSAFTLAYALFEIPGGWLGDRFGPRKILLRVVCWWSFFTAATGWSAWIASLFKVGDAAIYLGFADRTTSLRIASLSTLVAVRFLFGAGEAGCFPNITRAFMNWLLPHERVRAQSVLWLCARWGGAITPALLTIVLQWVTWQNSFVLFGCFGLVWAVLFFIWFRDDPKDHRGVNAAEKRILAPNAAYAHGHGKVPWGVFLSSRTAWMLWLQYACLSYVWYFYVTWLPTFIKESYGATRSDMVQSLLAGVPLFCGGIGSFFSGFIAAKLSNLVGGMANTRKILSVGGFLCMGLSIFLASRLKQPEAVLASFGAASFFGDLAMPCSWGTCMDIGGRFAGTLSGSMNMTGNLGGALSSYVLPYILRLASNEWRFVFYTYAATCVVGAISWMLIDTETPLDGRTNRVARSEPEPEDKPAEMIEEL